jgi:hypothetical protein
MVMAFTFAGQFRGIASRKPLISDRLRWVRFGEDLPRKRTPTRRRAIAKNLAQ